MRAHGDLPPRFGDLRPGLEQRGAEDGETGLPRKPLNSKGMGFAVFSKRGWKNHGVRAAVKACASGAGARSCTDGTDCHPGGMGKG